jgi:nucleotide-binding universal stress UspA family protein
MLKIAKSLCPVDFSEFSARALDCGYSLAHHYDSRLFVQHVTEPVLSVYEGHISPEIVQIAYSQKLIHIEAQMCQLVGKCQGENVQCETVVQVGAAGDLILAFAAEHKIDLITMGTHGRRGFDRLDSGRPKPAAVVAKDSEAISSTVLIRRRMIGGRNQLAVAGL